jgi:voltage-gated sodium channel
VHAAGTLRGRIAEWVESDRAQLVVTLVIIANAITLGLETSERVTAAIGPLLHVLDRAFLTFFVAEIALKLYAHGLRFFRSGWNVFDFLVVGITLLPADGDLTVLRTLRILRALRLISVVPSFRRVVEALLDSLPGLGAIAGLLGVLLYVAAVMSTKLFGELQPEMFGSIGASLFTLFQIMTLEGWADIARDIMEPMPLAWLFFIPFILVATFAVLNLVIGIIVNSLQTLQEAEERETREVVHAEGAEVRAFGHEERTTLAAEIAALRREVQELRGELARTGTAR